MASTAMIVVMGVVALVFIVVGLVLMKAGKQEAAAATATATATATETEQAAQAEGAVAEQQQAARPARGPRRRAGGAGGAAGAGAAAPVHAVPQPVAVIGDGDADAEEIDESTLTDAERKKLRKERGRAARRAAYEAQHGGELAAQREKEEARLAREEEREAARLEKLEAERAAEFERKRQEDDEYEDWAAGFEVEDAGEVDEAEELRKMEQFVAFIKHKKVVVLEDVAAKFSMRSADVLTRIRRLEEMGKLSGVIDDRGKYIYITDEEWDKVRSFVQRRGRISITELAAKSSELVDLAEGAADDDDDAADDEDDDDAAGGNGAQAGAGAGAGEGAEMDAADVEVEVVGKGKR